MRYNIVHHDFSFPSSCIEFTQLERSSFSTCHCINGDKLKQEPREGNVNVQRFDQRCGKAGHVKAPLLLLSASLRQKPADHAQSRAPTAPPIAASQEQTPKVGGDGLGKLMLKGAPRGEMFCYAFGLDSHSC